MTGCKRCGKFPLHMTEGEFHQAMQEAARAENHRVLDEVEEFFADWLPIGISQSQRIHIMKKLASLRLEGEKK